VYVLGQVLEVLVPRRPKMNYCHLLVNLGRSWVPMRKIVPTPRTILDLSLYVLGLSYLIKVSVCKLRLVHVLSIYK